MYFPFDLLTDNIQLNFKQKIIYDKLYSLKIVGQSIHSSYKQNYKPIKITV